MYIFVEEWEPDDLSIPEGCEIECGGGGTEQEAKDQEFSKSCNACVTVYVPTTAWTYLSIRSEWFNRYVGDEICKIYD